MKATVRKSATRIVKILPFFTLRVMVHRRLIQLFYHVVSDHPLPHTCHLYPYRSAQLFEQDLVLIKRSYVPISFHQLEAGFTGRKTAVHVSFDDGFSECFTVVRPLLLKHSIPCTFFLTTDFIDNKVMFYRNQVSLCIEQVKKMDGDETADFLKRLQVKLQVSMPSVDHFIVWIKSLTDQGIVNQVCKLVGVDVPAYLRRVQPYLTREQIIQMHAEGFTIGAHSRRHRKLSRLSEAEMAEEIVGSCRVVAGITGQERVPFSFPNSGDGVSPGFLRDLRKSHPEVGLIFDTKGLKANSDIVFNRVWMEAPKYNPQGDAELPVVLKRAYQDFLLNFNASPLTNLKETL